MNKLGNSLIRVNLDATPSKCMPPHFSGSEVKGQRTSDPEKCVDHRCQRSRSWCDLLFQQRPVTW